MPESARPTKVGIIGAGFVGSTFAYSLMISGLVSEIVISDVNHRKAEGEVMDLNHGLAFVRPVSIRVGGVEDCSNADVVVITAGAAQKPGETRLDLVHRNFEIFQELVPNIVRHAREDTVLLVVTNPVDIMTYAAYKFSGYPPSRVIGSGTVLDTSRLRYLLSVHCGVNPRNVHAYIVGEHGDSEVAIWSLANIAGMRLSEYCPTCGKACKPGEKDKIFNEVREAAYHIIERKGATYYAVGLALLEIVEAILRGENSVLTVSCLLDGYFGMKDICMSVPTVVNRSGIERVVEIWPSEEEVAGFKKSAAVLREVLDSLHW